MNIGTRVRVIPWDGLVCGLTFFPSMFCLEGKTISNEQAGVYKIIDDLGLTWVIPTSQLEQIEETFKNTDTIVETVINKFKQRSESGIKKYNTTLERNDLSTLEWLLHLQEELMDATLYIERLKKEYESTN